MPWFKYTNQTQTTFICPVDTLHFVTHTSTPSARIKISFFFAVDDLVNIAQDSTASMYSFEAGHEPQLVPASHAVDGFIPDSGNFGDVSWKNINLKQ